MKAAYVDSSSFVAVALEQLEARKVRGRLGTFQRIFASNLLEAEVRSALRREDIHDFPETLLDDVNWVLPDRPLTPELQRVLALGWTRGADLWHLACALFVAPNPRQFSFVTLDDPQRDLARRLGFTV